jgi:hypothetical protein
MRARHPSNDTQWFSFTSEECATAALIAYKATHFEETAKKREVIATEWTTAFPDLNVSRGGVAQLARRLILTSKCGENLSHLELLYRVPWRPLGPREKEQAVSKQVSKPEYPKGIELLRTVSHDSREQ